MRTDMGAARRAGPGSPARWNAAFIDIVPPQGFRGSQPVILKMKPPEIGTAKAAPIFCAGRRWGLSAWACKTAGYLLSVL
jgi:hypothetical protein